jgi:hypothetical protein
MPRVRTLPIADRTPPLVAQRLSGCGLEPVPILVCTPHGFLEPRQILRDPDAWIFPKKGGDRVRELTARGVVLGG